MHKPVLHGEVAGGGTSGWHFNQYREILRYFFPEFVNAIVLYTITIFIDVLFIAHLKATTSYALIGVTNTFIFFLNKVAEGISVIIETNSKN